jgi:hypothetical protein
MYVFADDTLGGFSCGFRYNSSRVEIDTIVIDDAAFPPGESAMVNATLLAGQRMFLIGGADLAPLAGMWGLWEGEHIADLVFDLDPATPDTVITIDSTFVPPAGLWRFAVWVNGQTTVLSISPEFQTGRIVIGAPPIPCGDLDGSGAIDVADALLLIYYVFAQGPPPIDVSGGDVDCDGKVNITDAVYLIAYIFSFGAPPCANCP